jgi:diguanylate cyclase (GGDEF)-like protein/PAS domain S-box-containing protein
MPTSEIRPSSFPDNTDKLGDVEFNEEELFGAGHHKPTVAALAALLLAICIFAILFYYWVEGKLGFNVPLVLAPILIMVLGLVKRGHAISATRILLWGLLLGTMAGSYAVSGLTTPTLFLLPILMMSAFWLLSRREAVLMFVVACLNLSWQVYIQTHGWLPPISVRSPIYYFLAIVGVMMAALLLGNAVAKNLISQYRRIRTMNQDLMNKQVLLSQEITDRKKADADLKHSEEQLRFVLEGAEQGFWDWDIAANTVKRNQRWAEILGYTYEEINETTLQWTNFVYPDDRDRAWHSINEVLEGRSPTHKLEYRMLHKDGSIRWILDQAKVMQRDGQGKATRMCGTHTDVTERKLLELELTRQAHIDYLTEVCNRRHFMERAEQELRRASRYNNKLAILMLDIDHFKLINDRYGHKVGDAALQVLTKLCQSTLRDIDILGRLGGEEFAVLLPETERSAAIEVAERLRAEIAKSNMPLEGGLPIQITVSIGVSSMMSPDDNIDVLLNRADKALYQAKNSGRDRVCASSE